MARSVERVHVLVRSIPPIGLALLLVVPLLSPASASADWRVRCGPEGVCQLLVDGARRELPGDADQRRGELRCRAQGPWLVCTWTHVSQLHMNEAYFIDLETRDVHRIRLDDLTMRADGSFGRLVGPPRWDGAGVRLVVERGARRHWIWRALPARTAAPLSDSEPGP